MRPGATFQSPSTAAAAAGPVHQTTAHSAWHSPVPYLFGGLAAMLGLIAFALLILACSYWKLSGYLDGNDGDGDNQTSGGEKSGEAAEKLPPPSFEPRIVVIMAGEEKPTFLATPMSSRASSFGDNSSSKSTTTGTGTDDEKSDYGEGKTKEGGNKDGKEESSSSTA